MQQWVWLATTLIWCSGCAARGPGQSGADAAPTPPPVLWFGPSVSSYLSTSHRSVEREIAGATRSDSMFLRYQFTAAIRDGDSGLVVSFAIDTVLGATAPNIVQSDIDQVKGVTYTALLSTTGRMDELRASRSSSPLLDVLAAQAADLFPVLPAGGLMPSQTWVDSTETQRVEGGALLTFQVITHYRSHAWSDADGAMVLPVDWEQEYRVGGSGDQFGREFTLRGNGTVSGRSWFARDGLFVGSVSEDNLVAQLAIDDLGIMTPVRQQQVDTVRVLQ